MLGANVVDVGCAHVTDNEKRILVSMLGVKIDSKGERVVGYTDRTVVERKLAPIDEFGVDDNIVVVTRRETGMVCVQRMLRYPISTLTELGVDLRAACV